MRSITRIISLLLLSGILLRAQDEPATTPAKAENPPAAAGVPQPPENPLPEPAEPAEPEWDGRRNVRRDRGSHSTPSFGQDIVVRKDETLRELVLIGGSADIQGEIERDVVAIGASVKLSGRIGGNLVIVGGEANLAGEVQRDTVVVLGRGNIEKTANLEQDAVLIGGPFNVSPEASIGGENVTIPFGNFFPKIEWVKKYFVSGPLLGRWLTFNLGWPWAVAGTFLAVYLATLLVFPAAARAVYMSLEERPVSSIFTGLLTLVLFAPLVFLLVISVAGILVVPFLKIALVLALLFGKVGVICFLGRGVGKTTGATSLQAPLLAFFAGAIILTLCYAVPLFGIFAWGLATVFGLGGAIMALSNTFKREEAKVPPASVLVSTVRPEGMGVHAGTGTAGTAPTVSDPIFGAGGGGGTLTATAVAPPMTHYAGLNPQDTVLLTRAGFWARFLASILDLLVVLATVIALPLIGPVLFIPLAVVYFVAMWTWKGTTIGGLVMGHKIVRTDGRPVDFAVALVRSLTSLFSLVVFFLGFLWAGWDREKQTWHDKIAGTVVVRMPKGFSLL